MSGITVANSIGAETVGVTCALFLGGICFQQAYRYFATYPRDRWQFRLLVAVLSCLNLAQSSILIYMVYHWDVTRWGSSRPPGASKLGYALLDMFSTIIVTPVQLFYAYRIYAMKRNYIIPGIVVVFSVIQFILSLLTAIQLLSASKRSQLSSVEHVRMSTIDHIGIAIVIINAIIDIIITFTILQKLRHTKDELSETKSAIRKIAFLNIQTNSTATVFAIITVVLFFSSPTGWTDSAFMCCVKFYMISLFAVLNARPIPTDLAATDAHFLSCPPSILFPEYNKHILTTSDDVSVRLQNISVKSKLSSSNHHHQT